MRVANVKGRLSLVVGFTYTDVFEESGGRFGPEPQSAFADWDAFASWASTVKPTKARDFRASDLGPPVPFPRQVFGIGLNYRGHAAEAGLPLPEAPPVFTKFPTCLVGPVAEVTLPTASVDWEVELVVVIGRTADKVSASHAWSHVAGLTLGQDLSERTMQLAGPVPQFSLAKSFAGFGPIGPVLVSLDEFENPDDVEIACSLNGEERQHARTGDLIFGVPELIARLSAICTLLPGDLIFTGTPAGVGLANKPPRFLTAGDVLHSTSPVIGDLHTSFVAVAEPAIPASVHAEPAVGVR